MISSKCFAITTIGLRAIRSYSVVATKLVYSEYGEPEKVLYPVQENLSQLANDQVLVKILAAPINPADINTIQGRYPVKPQFPAVPGNECVAEVLKVGSAVTHLANGDHVVPFSTGIGTWRTHAIFNSRQVLKVPKTLGLIEACTMTVNPPTAYRMLKDFVVLSPNDTIIQNGANSAVGQAVFQFAKYFNIKCIGVVRDRPEIEKLREYLEDLGAAEVLTEEELRKTTIFKDKLYPAPKLALNCVGGRSSQELVRHLAHGGVMVTYGGMSREPVIIPTSALIFKDISFHGFWMTRWTAENQTSATRDTMFDKLIHLMTSGKLRGPMAKEVPFDNFKEAVANALNFSGFIGQKYILRF